MPISGKPKTTGQEGLLLDYIQRLEQHKKGRHAVHIHLSRLKPFNRRDHHIRAATS
ncbi:MAG: EAL domain-containing protein, partial [Rhodospirillales bacterium]|nr:EAL domain-containing protein [Rhodospirillales bacterium]